jgi:purine-binding chemotaxis protein CheW
LLEEAMAEVQSPRSAGDVPSRGREGKYLTFTLQDEEYGIGILEVKEIIGMMAVTPIPQTPEFLKGVINLRGKVIPVVDLRLKFGLEEADYDERTCIIVVEVRVDGGITLLGTVVDAVNEVAQLKSEDIEDAPSFGRSAETSYILGMAKSGDKVKTLLDIARVLSQEDLQIISQAA